MNKLYKNTLAVTICLLLIGCDAMFPEEKWARMSIYNYTNKDISIFAGYNMSHDTLPLDSTKLSLYGYIIPSNYLRSIKCRHFNDPGFKRIKNGDTLSFFVLDKGAILENTWSEIHEKGLIKKRYDMYLERCKEWHWQIDYTGK